MSVPHCHLFSLSNELLIEIISNLCPVDIYACQCTCRRLNSVVINSHLIQYIKRTALNGVFDSFEPGLSLPDRLDVLERWETAWMEMDLCEPNAIIDASVAEGACLLKRRFLSGQYIVRAVSIGASSFYSFLDMHARSSHTNAARWTTIEIDSPVHLVHVLSFASELNLIVTISYPISLRYNLRTTMTIRPLQFSTGEPHPLARQPKLEVSVSGIAAYYQSDAMVIGDYILFWVGGVRNNGGSSVCISVCSIYLVAWKEGWVSELLASPLGVYRWAFSVLSEEIILLLRQSGPAPELCLFRLSNIDDREKASLEIVRILSLPVLTAGTSLQWAVCFTEHPGHVLFSKDQQQNTSLHLHGLLSSSSGLSTQEPEDRIDTRRHLHPIPADGIVVVQMHLRQLHNNSSIFDLTVRRRTLLGFSNSQAQAGAAGTGAGTGVGTAVAVPWEKWGTNNADILEHGPLMCGGSHFGERRAIALPTCITIWDYNPFRVQRALKLFGGAEKEVTLECGSVVKVVKEKLMYRGGEFFCDNIETSLEHVKTVVPYNRCDGILMDKDNFVVVQSDIRQFEKKFYLYSL